MLSSLHKKINGKSKPILFTVNTSKIFTNSNLKDFKNDKKINLNPKINGSMSIDRKLLLTVKVREVKKKPKVAAGGWGSFCFKCPFLHQLILSIVFHTFLNTRTSNKKYMLKNGSI